MIYRPEPIDTYKVILPKDLEQLIELLAINAHEIWSKERIAEGWTYGFQRDERQKKHPDLVPYNELPESEREYDRKIVIETIKAILALGYQIKKRESSQKA